MEVYRIILYKYITEKNPLNEHKIKMILSHSLKPYPHQHSDTNV